MGIVKLKRVHGYMHKGTSYGTDVLYVYCDECGSFSIETYVSVRKWIIIVVSCVIMTTAIFAKAAFGSYWVIYIFLCCFVCWTLAKLGWGDKDYRCRKCRNVHIVINDPKDYASVIPKYNTRNYPLDMEVLDVPEDLTQKRYQGYWDEDYQ